MLERDLVATGIAGLDDILSGGLLRGSVILVEGGAGTGKTARGMGFIHGGVSDVGVAGLLVLFDAGWNTPEAFHLLAEGLQRERLTAMLGVEVAATDGGRVAAALPEEFIADTVIQLRLEPMERAVQRSIEIIKARGQDYRM